MFEISLYLLLKLFSPFLQSNKRKTAELSVQLYTYLSCHFLTCHTGTGHMNTTWPWLSKYASGPSSPQGRVSGLSSDYWNYVSTPSDKA